MDYPHIKEHLGNKWLGKQEKFIETREWIDENVPKEMISNEPAYYVLKKIDDLIKKFENTEGFHQWAKEAKTSKNFEDCLFELMALENLLLKSDKIVLKPINSINGLVPEASIRKEEDKFFIEMTKIRSMRGSIQNKVEKLFGKARKKFEGSQGIHFVGAFNFFDYENGVEKPSPKFNLLKKLINFRFERESNSTIMAFVLVNIFFATNPNLKKTFIQKRYHIIEKPINKGGKPLKFFKDLFEVDGFLIL